MWVANSVGLLNYKAFLLFLLYTFLACTLVRQQTDRVECELTEHVAHNKSSQNLNVCCNASTFLTHLQAGRAAAKWSHFFACYRLPQCCWGTWRASSRALTPRLPTMLAGTSYCLPTDLTSHRTLHVLASHLRSQLKTASRSKGFLGCLAVALLLPWCSETDCRWDVAHRFALTMIAFVVDLAFCLSLGGLLAMHARMVWLNCTTIEMFEKQRAAQWPYDRGPRRNFEEVFGTR